MTNHSNTPKRKKATHARTPSAQHSRKPVNAHAKTPASIDPGVDTTTTIAKDKLNIIIQVPGESDVLRVKLPKNTSLGEIKEYLNKKYGEDGKYMFISQINSKPVENSSTKVSKPSQQDIKTKTPNSEKVGIIVKSSVGDDNDEAKVKIPKGTKVKSLKEALAKKFDLSPNDFELMHVSSKTPV